MSATSSFSELVDRYRRTMRKAGDRPLTYSSAAKKLGISRTQLYNLMNGDQGAGTEVEAKLAKVLGLSVSTVHRGIATAKMTGRS